MEPLVSSQELRPFVQLLFRKRFHFLTILVLATVITYLILYTLKVATYQATSVVMMKLPLIDFEFKVEPNPQVAPAYIDLAMSDGLFNEVHQVITSLRKKADAGLNGFPSRVDAKDRDRYLRELQSKQDLLNQLAQDLPEEWQREVFSDPNLLLGLYEFKPAHLEKIPLYTMQESFRVKSDIAQQTNVTMINSPFLNFHVEWTSPGSAALLSTVWAHIFVERANAVALEVGNLTEKSILRESSKIEEEVKDLKIRLSKLRADPLYQDFLRVKALENSLYGSTTQIDMFGYVELHTEIALQSGLTGELQRKEMEGARLRSELEMVRQLVAGNPASATPDIAAAQVRQLEAQLKRWEVESLALQTRMQEIREEIAKLRETVAPFEAEYRQLEFSIDQRTRILSERLTTAIFLQSRLKSGYALPPMVFVEPAVPPSHRSGPPRSLLALAVGFILSFAYASWVVYRGFLVPTLT